MFWVDQVGTKLSLGEEISSALLIKQNESISNAIKEKLEIIDISTLNSKSAAEHSKNSWPIVRYEIDRLRPNYGAASDMLRYEILFQHGGVYIDSDVEPPNNKASSIYANRDFWTRASHLYVYRSGSANDVILSPVGSEGALQLKTHVQDNYGVPRSVDNEDIVKTFADLGMRNFTTEHFMEAYPIVQTYALSTNHHIREATLMRTGPRVLNNVFGYYSQKNPPTVLDATSSDNRNFNEKFIDWFNNRAIWHFQEQHLIRDTASAQDWLGLPPKKFSDLSQAIAVVQETIRFEAQYLKIFRLNEHLLDLNNMFKNTPFAENPEMKPEEKAEFILEKLLSALSGPQWDTLFSKVEAVQAPFSFYKLTEFISVLDTFLKKHSLQDKTGFASTATSETSFKSTAGYLTGTLEYYVAHYKELVTMGASAEKLASIAYQETQQLFDLIEYTIHHQACTDSEILETLEECLNLVEKNPILCTENALKPRLNQKDIQRAGTLHTDLVIHQIVSITRLKVLEKFEKYNYLNPISLKKLTSEQVSKLSRNCAQQAQTFLKQGEWPKNVYTILTHFLLHNVPQIYTAQHFSNTSEVLRNELWKDYKKIVEVLQHADLQKNLPPGHLNLFKHMAIQLSEGAQQSEESKRAFQETLKNIKTLDSHEESYGPIESTRRSESTPHL